MSDRSKPRFSLPFTLALFVVYVVFLAGYGIAMLSPHVSPLKTQIPEYFNLAFGFMLIPLFFFLVYFLLHPRKSGLFLVFHFALIAFTSGYVTTFFPLNVGEGLKRNRDLRVMTYNVKHFTARLTAETPPYAVGVIKKYNPDIVCIQETGLSSSDELLVKAMRTFFTEEAYPVILPNAGKGLTLLSRYPVVSHHPVDYQSYTNGSESYVIDVEGRKLLLINNHLESYSLTSDEKEKYRDFISDFSPRRIWDQFKEVKRRLSPNMNIRVKAAEATRADFEKTAGQVRPDASIITGDFNDTPMSYVYSVLKADGMRDAYQRVGLGPGFTFNERWMPFRIDHVLYSGSLRAVGGRIPWEKSASDHNPVIIDFEWE